MVTRRPRSLERIMDDRSCRAHIQVGDPVFFDTAQSGRVPCEVIDRRASAWGGQMLTLRVTGARYAYPLGYTFAAHTSPFVVPRWG